MRWWCLGLLVLVACGGDEEGAAGTPWTTEPLPGIATYYAATGAGACSYEASSDLDVVALGDGSYDDASMCGACVEVVGPKGAVVVRVVDRCPECADEHLDLSQQAFEKIADRAQGRVEIEYSFTSCEVSGPLRYRFKDGSSRYWTGIQVQNHKLPVTKLEVRKEGSWLELKREHYNYFVTEDGVGLQPEGLAVRVTSVSGQVLQDTLGPVGDDPLSTAVQEGQAQFD